jgi:2-haloacid dehalogenase
LIRALVFDVFGTVVDWRGSIVRHGEASGLDREWGAFADELRRDGYLAPLGAHLRGEAPWLPHGELMRRQLARIDVPADRVEELVGWWHRLDPWPDALDGLHRLRERFTIGPLSNGGFGQLTAMAKAAGLPWDCILSTDIWRTYKPDPATYLGAAELLGLAPHEVMLVAAHPADLQAAARNGLGTAYVPRPLEWGPDGPTPGPDEGFDVVATDFVALADALG